jgi:hypothetical protein
MDIIGDALPDNESLTSIADGLAKAWELMNDEESEESLLILFI